MCLSSAARYEKPKWHHAFMCLFLRHLSFIFSISSSLLYRIEFTIVFERVCVGWRVGRGGKAQQRYTPWVPCLC